MRHCTLENTVPGDLTHVAGTQLEDLCCDGVFFHQGFLATDVTTFMLQGFDMARCFAFVSCGGRVPPWCSGTAWGHQWRGKPPGLSSGTPAEGFWHIPRISCCYWGATWQWGSEPGSTDTGAQDSGGGPWKTRRRWMNWHSEPIPGGLSSATRFSKTPRCFRKRGLTFLRLRPWEMLSAVMKQASRWVMAPASPQWGLNKKVFMPLCLENRRLTGFALWKLNYCHAGDKKFEHSQTNVTNLRSWLSTAMLAYM